MEAQTSDMSLNESLEDNHSFLDMELEALQSIYINEIEVDTNANSTTLSIVLHPATADKLDEQYVRMTLQFMLEEKYPEDVPKIKIRNPRGLSDEKLNCVMKDLLAIAESKKGNSMLFEMIEAAKEHLTTGNRPCGECAICLYGFSDNDVFTKTECYHYFHSHCLARYTKNFIENANDYQTDPKSKSLSNELLCPMCRIPIQFSDYEEDFPPPQASDESSFVLSDEILELQKKMASLYQKQVEKGGIIDIEAEKNKFLIEISNVPTRFTNEEKCEHKLYGGDCPADEQEKESSNQINSYTTEVKDHLNERFNYRGKHRNYNKQNESRGNFRYGGRYNKATFHDFRGKYNKTKYDRSSQKPEFHHSHKYNSDSVPISENSAIQSLHIDDEEFTDPILQFDNISENTEHEVTDTKSKRYSSSSPRYDRQRYKDFSPKYNRGHHQGSNYHYNSRYDGRRSDKFIREKDCQATSKICESSVDNYKGSMDKSEDQDQVPRTCNYAIRKPNYHSDNRGFNSKERHEKKVPIEDIDESSNRDIKDRTSNFGSRKFNYRSDNSRYDKDFNSRERYSDNRSSRTGHGGYGRRGNYSYDSNYTGRNRYFESDKDYYTDRDRNFRGRTPQDKYRKDNTYDRCKQQTSKKFSEKNYVKYTEEHFSPPSENNHESVDETYSSELSNNTSREQGNLDNISDFKNYHESLHGKNKANADEYSCVFDKKNSKKLTDKCVQDRSEPNVPSAMCDKPQGGFRSVLNPPPGFANPLKKVIYGLQGANPPPGFNRS